MLPSSANKSFIKIKDTHYAGGFAFSTNSFLSEGMRAFAKQALISIASWKRSLVETIFLSWQRS